MMKQKTSKVILIPASAYDDEEVYENLDWACKALGGIEDILKGCTGSSKILLKPNLVRKAEVSRAVMTHPVVMGAIARILYEHHYENVSAGDSCGIGMAKKVMEGTGMIERLEKYGVKICDFDSGTRTDIGGTRAKYMVMCDQVLKADAVINVCKMKTHALERITGAVKNIYGTVYGLHKAKGHTQFSDAHSFAGMLVDLNRFVGPKLHIMDGITAMEGNGPTSGDPVDMNLILVSKDPVALDSVYCRLIGLDSALVPTNVAGQAAGLGVMETSRIEVETPEGVISMEDAVRKYGKTDFNVDRKKHRDYARWIKMLSIFKIFQKKPYIDTEKCIRCGICVESCPVETKAISFKNGRKHPPVYDYKKCISCFCCQEMCPHKAIRVK